MTKTAVVWIYLFFFSSIKLIEHMADRKLGS